MLTKFANKIITSTQESLAAQNIRDYVMEMRGLGGFTTETVMGYGGFTTGNVIGQPTHRIRIDPLYQITPAQSGMCDDQVDLLVLLEISTYGAHKQSTPPQTKYLSQIVFEILVAIKRDTGVYYSEIINVRGIYDAESKTWAVEGLLKIQAVQTGLTN